jgi:hypothetical protein
MKYAAAALCVIVAACSDSAEDHLAELEAHHDEECLRYEWCGVTEPFDTGKAMLCMNRAYYEGRRAMASWQKYDAAYYDITTYVFTDSRTVRAFVSTPDGAGGYAITEEPPCTGSPGFSVSQELLCPEQNRQPLLDWRPCD